MTLSYPTKVPLFLGIKLKASSTKQSKYFVYCAEMSSGWTEKPWLQPVPIEFQTSGFKKKQEKEVGEKNSDLVHITGLSRTSWMLRVQKGMGLVFVTHR